MRQLHKSTVPFIPDFYTCGEYLTPVDGKSCGCILSLKTLFTDIFKCPQNKWDDKTIGGNVIG